jgi:hypothetical protein
MLPVVDLACSVSDNRSDADQLRGGHMRYVVVALLLASGAFAGEPVYSWRTRADDPDRAYLYADGKQIGGWCYRAKQFRPFDGKDWGPQTDVAPVRPPVQRVLVITQQTPMTITQPSPTPLQLRGPLRVKLGTAMGQLFADMTMHMIEDVIPRAIADSLARGQYQLDVQLSVTRSPQQSEGRTTAPSPSQPAKKPER